MTIRLNLPLSCVLILIAACATTHDVTEYDGAILYTGAAVWTDGRFVEKPFAVKDGVFIAAPKRPVPTLETVDLDGRFVIPPFGDSHTHKIEGTWALERFNTQFFEQGVFYAQNPAGLPRLMKQAREYTNRPDTIDVAYAMGGVTTPFGHPERGFVEFMTQYAYRGETRESLRGTAIHAVKNEDDIKRAIEILRADEADFVKIFLEFSEEYDERSAVVEAAGENTDSLDPFASSGMDDDLVPAAVRYAHAAGLPVKAHVTTAHDFRVAAAAGVDEILHMPGVYPHGAAPLSVYELTADDATAAAEADIDVVATTAARLSLIDDEQRAAVYDLQKRNVRTLLDNGVSVLIGIDNYGETTRTEIDHLRSIGAMSDEELLSAWIATGQSIFPERKIGVVAPGYEASFLVLDANPLNDFSTLDRIVSRTKEGQIVVLEPPEE